MNEEENIYEVVLRYVLENFFLLCIQHSFQLLLFFVTTILKKKNMLFNRRKSTIK